MRLRSAGPDETKRIGERIGKCLKKGDVVCLFGELGAGKTTMIKGIATPFGIDERDITSASFTIIAEYETEPPFYHIDLYRLSGGDDVFEAGVYDALTQNSVAVIEWSERLDDIPENAAKVRISIENEEIRTIEIEGLNEKNWNNL